MAASAGLRPGSVGGSRNATIRVLQFPGRAADGARTHDLELGKLAHYQLCYGRTWSFRPLESLHAQVERPSRCALRTVTIACDGRPERVTGLEPAIFWMGTRCSTNRAAPAESFGVPCWAWWTPSP